MRILLLLMVFNFSIGVVKANPLDLLSSEKNQDALMSGYNSHEEVYKEGESLELQIIQDMDLYRDAFDGKRDAEHQLGMIYYKGKGTNPDKEKAAYWFGRSARRGEAVSQAMLGICFERGDCGLQINEKKAVYWYKKAAKEGNLDRAMTLLGLAYANGMGVEQDYDEAFMWLNMASSKGHAEAQKILAKWYLEGTKLDYDYDKAINLLKSASDQGDKEALELYQKYYLDLPKNGVFAN